MTPGSFPLQPAIAAPVQQAAAAPATSPPASTDFLLMLAQLVGAPAVSAGATQGQMPVSAATDSDEATDDAATSDVALMFPFSLPVISLQPQSAAFTAQAGVAQVSGDVSRAPVMSLDAKLLADLIESEQAADDPAVTFDSVQLPAAPAESLHLTRTHATDALLSRPVHAPVASAQWADEIGSRLSLMLDQGRQSASLRLSPEHLGPLEIRIAIHDDQASVWFGASHADTRAAIESALPRLRELFASQGLSLADAGVFREPPREHAQQGLSETTAAADQDAAEQGSITIRRISLGLIDAYA